jgi:hypothetical protein
MIRLILRMVKPHKSAPQQTMNHLMETSWNLDNLEFALPNLR